MTGDHLIIRPCERTDIANIAHLQPDGWESITGFFEIFCGAPACHPVVARYAGDVIGIANAIDNGRTGWLSHIIVDDWHRRKGFGRSLTQHVMDYLRERGCTTQLLIATALGEPVYAKLGFKTVSIYHFYRGPQAEATSGERLHVDLHPDTANLRRLVAADYAAVYRMDQAQMGENRRAMLERFDTAGWGYFDPRSRELRGYYLPEVGEGLIVAKDTSAGIELLKVKLGRGPGKTVLPAENTKGNELLAANGYECYLKAPRMILGEKIAWDPLSLFSRIGGWYG